MLYERIYYSIIKNAKNRKLNEYKEKHHIIPRCLGGDDSSENLVSLTYREHFICHKLLCKMYPGNLKLIYALSFMIYGSKTQTRIIRSKDFEYVKRILAPHIGSWNKGKTPWNKGLNGNEFKKKNPNHVNPPNMRGYKWINNGVEQTKIGPSKELPNGWSYGRIDNKGNNNPMRKKNVV